MSYRQRIIQKSWQIKTDRVRLFAIPSLNQRYKSSNRKCDTPQNFIKRQISYGKWETGLTGSTKIYYSSVFQNTKNLASVSVQQKLIYPNQMNQKKQRIQQLRQTEDTVNIDLKTKKHHKIQARDFIKIKLIGKGKHGLVYLAMHKITGFIGALKIFQKNKLSNTLSSETTRTSDLIVKQAKIHSLLSHQNIIKLYSIFADKENVYFFMELGSEGQLYEHLQKKKYFRQDSISFICRNILDALNYLHQEKIIHRDLKPENIVIAHGLPKICDFGQSSYCDKDKGLLRQTLCGTPLYLSPEVLKGQKYDEKIDIWSIGAMAYQLSTGTNPFKIRNKQELSKIVTQKFTMDEGSLEFKNFLIYCLKKNPNERPSADKLLEHPFITKYKDFQTAQQLCL